MPLFYQHQINESTRLGIWKIEEEEAFFLKRVPPNATVRHPHKRLQHLAGRYLLPFLFEDFPLSEILIADTRKPFLHNEQYHFSISHCGSYAAAIVSNTRRVGIDIELVTPKIEKVKHKFLAGEEWEIAARQIPDFYAAFPFPDQLLLTLLWSCKEAIFKWYGHGELDFKTHMVLRSSMSIDEGQLARIPFFFQKDGVISLELNALVFDSLVLVWVDTPGK